MKMTICSPFELVILTPVEIGPGLAPSATGQMTTPFAVSGVGVLDNHTSMSSFTSLMHIHVT